MSGTPGPRPPGRLRRLRGNGGSTETPTAVPIPSALPFEPHALAGQFGTPFYVYDLARVSRRAAMLRDALPRRVDIAYAMKANPCLAVVAHLVDEGLGVDVASGGELATALRAGAPPGTIIFTGPGKRESELVAALDTRVRALTVESLGELERLERVASARGIEAPVLLRAATAGPGEARSIIGGDGAAKFGMSPRDLHDAAERAARSSSLRLLGIHAFGASNVRDADALADHVEWTVALARRLAERVGIPARLIDVGGGLGIPYADDEAPLDVARFGARLAIVDRRMAADPHLAGARILLEPGRFLVGPAGWFVTRIVDVKRSRRRDVAIADGGINHLIAPALLGRRHRVSLHPPAGASRLPHRGRRADRARRAAHRSVLLAGPLCTGIDVLDAEARIESPRPGDLLVFHDTGAYGFTESMPLFLSHPTPAEIALLGGQVHLVRPPIEPSAMLGLQLAIREHAPAEARDRVAAMRAR